MKVAQISGMNGGGQHFICLEERYVFSLNLLPNDTKWPVSFSTFLAWCSSAVNVFWLSHRMSGSLAANYSKFQYLLYNFGI